MTHDEALAEIIDMAKSMHHIIRHKNLCLMSKRLMQKLFYQNHSINSKNSNMNYKEVIESKYNREAWQNCFMIYSETN